MARPRVAAGVLISDDRGRVLLVKPTYKAGWDIPGGYVEPAEAPRQACVREVREELGVALEVGPLLVVDWAPHPDEGDKVLFVFAAGPVDRAFAATLTLQAGEIAHAAFFELDQLAERLPERLTKRLTQAVHARDDGRPRYLEGGEHRERD